MFVYASVNGVVSTVEVDAEAPCAGLVGKAAVPATVESIDVAVAAGFAYPAKMAEYNTVPTISASDVVVTATYSDKTTNTVTPTLVAYSTTEVSLTEVTKTSFNGTDKLYIYVEYGEGTNKKTDYVDVTSSLVDAYANDLVVDIAYDDEMVNAAGEPMVGAEVTATVKAINENGVVAVLESGTGYEVIAEEDSIPAAVAAKPFTFKVTAKVAASESTSAYLTSEEYTIAAGHSWIDGTALVTANAFGFVETYKPLIDTPLSGVEGNIAVLDAIYGSDKVAIKQGLEENAPVVTITAVSASGKDIAATGNTVLVTLEWIGSDGETDTKQVEYTFEGVNWIEPASTGFVILYDGEEYPVNDFPVSLNAFPVANFTIDTESYENHDSASAPTITKIVKDDVEYTSGQSITGLDVPGRVLNVVVSYNNGTADVEQTIVLTTGATTTLQ